MNSPSQPGWRLTWRRDVFLPVGVAIVSLGATHLAAAHMDQQPGPNAWTYVLVAFGAGALVARRRHPVAVLWSTFAAVLASAPLTGSAPRFAYFSLIVAFFVAATTGHRRAAWAAIGAGYVTSVWLSPWVWDKSAPSLSSGVLLATWLCSLVVAAEAWRMRQQREVEAKAARQLDAKHRASEERLRMARELHDVIGHSISLINIQAGVGLDLMDAQPEQARTALAAIKTVSKEALDELRTMLVALRHGEEDAPRAPVPGLDRLSELVSLTGAAGLAVTTDVIGEPHDLPAGVDRAAYRIVQESLTNVARHAGPAAVTVTVTYGEHDLIVEVDDDGRSPAGNALDGTGTGSGIPGMRERAAALGGRLDAGPRPGGGFQVVARLPLHGAP